jgi:nicotinamidase-related amidase
MPLTTLDRSAALVLIDLQAGITAMLVQPHGIEQLLERANAMASGFRGARLPVVHVRVSFSPDFGDVPPGRVQQAPGAPPSPGWDELDGRVEREGADLYVTKRSWGAFYGTDLDLQLRRRGVTQIVIAGISTTLGVESTARAAHEHGYNVVVVEDASGGESREQHDFTIGQVVPRLGEVASTGEVGEALAKR